MKKQVVKRKELSFEKWVTALLACFELLTFKIQREDIKQDGEGEDWRINIGDWLSISYATDEKVLDFLGKKVKYQYLGYTFTTYRSTYSYVTGHDVIEKEHGFYLSPLATVQAIVSHVVAERLGDVIENLEEEDTAKEEEEMQAAFEKVQSEQFPEPYEELSDDYRDRLEAHNRQVLSQL